MIQFNLLPNVKREYVKAKRTQRLTVLGAVLVAGASLLVLVLLFVNVQLQVKHSQDLSKDIKTESQKLAGTQNISSILTIQNQLNSLSSLHTDKPEAARVFDYIKKTTPVGVTISGAEINFEETTMKVTGKASSLILVNAYADTLKFTMFKTADMTDPGSAFSEVVLSALTTDSSSGSVTYELNFKYDAAIFSNASDVTLTVPSKSTTRSEIDKPNAVFQSEGNE